MLNSHCCEKSKTGFKEWNPIAMNLHHGGFTPPPPLQGSSAGLLIFRRNPKVSKTDIVGSFAKVIFGLFLEQYKSVVHM